MFHHKLRSFHPCCPVARFLLIVLIQLMQICTVDISLSHGTGQTILKASQQRYIIYSVNLPDVGMNNYAIFLIYKETGL